MTEQWAVGSKSDACRLLSCQPQRWEPEELRGGTVCSAWVILEQLPTCDLCKQKQKRKQSPQMFPEEMVLSCGTRQRDDQRRPSCPKALPWGRVELLQWWVTSLTHTCWSSHFQCCYQKSISYKFIPVSKRVSPSETSLPMVTDYSPSLLVLSIWLPPTPAKAFLWY